MFAAAAICVIAALLVTRVRFPHAVESRASTAPAPRLTAAPPWSSSDVARLAAAVYETLGPALGAPDWSLAVLAQDGTPIFDDRASVALTPASAQKLIVADAALRQLGAQYRFHTLLASSAAIAADGTLAGDLWLVGSGDPSLTSDDLRNGVAQAWRLGLRHVRGGVIADAGALPGPEINPFWNSGDVDEDYQAPTSALSLDQDTLEFHVIGALPGALARVTYVPRNDAIRVNGSVVSVSADSESNVQIVTRAPNVYQVSGSTPAFSEEKQWIPVHGMARYAGTVLERMLRDRGIAVDAPARTGHAPPQAQPIWDHRSRPLHELVRRMLFQSNNHFAEQLLRTLAAAHGSRFGDSAAIAAERSELTERGVPLPGLVLVDGSGLAHANRAAAITLASLLAKSDLNDLLPLGGRQGTLKSYPFTTALGRVRAKSGHIFGADSLAGYVNTAHHGRVTFAFIIAGSQGDAVDDAIVRAVDRLAAF